MTDEKTYPKDYSAIYVPKYDILIPRKVADVMIAYLEDRQQHRRKMRVTQSQAMRVFRDWLKETYPKRKIPVKSVFWYAVGSIEYGKAVPIKAKGLYEIEILKPELITPKKAEEVEKEAIRQGIILPKTTKVPEAEEIPPEELEKTEAIEELLAPEEIQPEELPPKTEIYTIGFTFRIGAQYSPRKTGGTGKGDIDIEAEFRISVDVPKELWENPTVRSRIIDELMDTVEEATDEFFEQDYVIKYVFESVGRKSDLDPQLEKWDIDDHFTVNAPPTEVTYSADVDYVNFARANRIGETRTRRPYYASQLLDRLEGKLVDVESLIDSFVSEYYKRR